MELLTYAALIHIPESNECNYIQQAQLVSWLMWSRVWIPGTYHQMVVQLTQWLDKHYELMADKLSTPRMYLQHACTHTHSQSLNVQSCRLLLVEYSERWRGSQYCETIMRTIAYTCAFVVQCCCLYPPQTLWRKPKGIHPSDHFSGRAATKELYQEPQLKGRQGQQQTIQ